MAEITYAISSVGVVNTDWSATILYIINTKWSTLSGSEIKGKMKSILGKMRDFRVFFRFWKVKIYEN